MTNTVYTIGAPGKPWGERERNAWYEQQTIKRSYQQQVVDKITSIKSMFTLSQYGSLDLDNDRYPLFAMLSNHWQKNNKTVLITGGVHGYETSGVQGAIRFLATCNEVYTEQFNIIVVPCVSPWGYETINRWNNNAVDPNRSFYPDSPAQESAQLIAFINKLNVNIAMHIDLHETTDTDNSEFRPALAARDAVEHTNWNIPDGFYLVGDSTKPVADFQAKIIEKVASVTHIAEADEQGKLIGVYLEQPGVINYSARSLGLCMGMTNADYVTTTEVYPDSAQADDEMCIRAQVMAITTAIDFLK